MLQHSVTLAAALVLSLLGAPPKQAVASPRRPAVAAPVQVAAGLWAPKKSERSSERPERSSERSGSSGGKSKRGDEGYSAKEEELLKPHTPTPASASRPRHRVRMEPPAARDEDEEDEEDDEEDSPRVKKRRKLAEDEDEEGDDEDEEEDVPLPSLPAVRPRLVTLFAGAGAVKRSFAYNTPLQGDNVLARMGYTLSLEAFPLLRTPPGFHRRIGVGAVYEKASGVANTFQSSDGSTVSYPVSHGHWGFDLRTFFALGERVVLAPAVGYGQASSDLQRRNPVMPSACILTNAQPCFADANVSFLSLDAHLRIALTSELSLALSGGYLAGLSVQRGMGQISSSEATAKLYGLHAELGLSYLIKDWFAVQGVVPFRRYAYAFKPAAGGAATYASAADTYYGLTVGIAVLAP
jgi:hypothetical protein